MIETVKIYGFGTYFSRTRLTPNDIDVLIVHERVDLSSINFAIACKRALIRLLPEAHITLLSETEERQLTFINCSQAHSIGQITNIGFDKQLANVASKLVGARQIPGSERVEARVSVKCD